MATRKRSVRRLAITVCFFVSEVILLVAFLATGIYILAAVTIETPPGVSYVLADEARRALGSAAVFIVLSGYIVSVAALLGYFRIQPLTLARAVWLVALFALHAGIFLFVMRAPAVVSTSLTLIAIGAVCVAAAASTEYILWRRWLGPV
jgi:hypothetical protein